MIKKTGILCLVLVLLGVGANVMGPDLAAEGLYQALSQHMELAPQDVQVHASPGAKVFAGQADNIQVHANRVSVNSVPFENFNCSLENVQFDLADTILEQRLSIISADRGEITASVRREDLRRFLMNKIDELSDVQVEFRDNEVFISGSMDVGGLFTAHASVSGAFGMKESKLMFIPDHVEVEGLGMTYRSTHIGSAEIYDFQSFPLGIQPDRVTMDGDVLTIYGQINNPQVR